ncbi:hypothetical protein GCM10009678_22390 [Actinomadura kijaniata]
MRKSIRSPFTAAAPTGVAVTSCTPSNAVSVAESGSGLSPVDLAVINGITFATPANANGRRSRAWTRGAARRC